MEATDSPVQLAQPTPKRFMLGGVAVSLIASSCCIGPFLLLATGVSGAWMSRLMVLQAYQPLFISLVLTFFAMAWVKIFRPFSSAPSGATAQQKAAFFLLFALALILLFSEYWIVWLA